MRLTRVPLVQIEDHVINLNFLLNACLEEDDYPARWGIRHFLDAAWGPGEDENGAQGYRIDFKTKKAATEALARLTSCTDTLVVDEEG